MAKTSKIALTVLAACAGALIILSPQCFRFRSALAVIDFVGARRHEFKIGSALVEIPQNWLLTSSRDRREDSPRLFGILPWWKPMGPGVYFAFFVVDSCDVPASIVFVESSSKRNDYGVALLAQIERGERANIEPAQIVAFGEWTAILADLESGLVLHVPDLGIEIYPSNIGLLDNLSVRGHLR